MWVSQVGCYQKQGFLLLPNLISPQLLAEVISQYFDDDGRGGGDGCGCDGGGDGDCDDDDGGGGDGDFESMQVSHEYDELFRRQAGGGGRMEARFDADLTNADHLTPDTNTDLFPPRQVGRRLERGGGCWLRPLHPQLAAAQVHRIQIGPAGGKGHKVLATNHYKN